MATLSEHDPPRSQNVPAPWDSKAIAWSLSKAAWTTPISTYDAQGHVFDQDAFRTRTQTAIHDWLNGGSVPPTDAGPLPPDSLGHIVTSIATFASSQMFAGIWLLSPVHPASGSKSAASPSFLNRPR